MSNAITDARTDVAEALAGIEGLQVFDFIPSRLSAPAAIVTPGSPYVVPGRVLGEFTVALNVRLFADQGTNEVVTKALDELIVSVCLALREFGVGSVAAPGISNDYESPYLVTDIAITTTYKNTQGGIN